MVVVACFSVGYIIRHSLDFISNKYIPLILAVFGACLANVMNGELTWELVICGAFSGLASTGAHQAFYQLVKDSTDS